MNSDRPDEEIMLLRSVYEDLESRAVDGTQWILIPTYPVPEGWSYRGNPIAEAEIAFQIPAQVGQPPYGFFVRPPLIVASGAIPSNYTAGATTPWGADFALFSWAPEEPWIPKTDLRAGANMLNFARSFRDRLEDIS
jgi:hypothetical protein